MGFPGARRRISSALYSPLIVSTNTLVIEVADAADGGFDAGFGQALGIADRDILAAWLPRSE